VKGQIEDLAGDLFTHPTSWVARVVSEPLIAFRWIASFRHNGITDSPLRPRSSPFVYVNLGRIKEQ
jgi:hypothetical protein